MICRLLDEHLRPDLDPAERASLARHAQVCPDCQRRLAQYRRAQQVLGGESPPYDPAMVARWRSAVASPPALSARLGVGVRWLAVAGAVLLLVGLGASRFYPRPSPQLISGGAYSPTRATEVSAGERLPTDTWLRLTAGSVWEAPPRFFSARTDVLVLMPKDPGQPVRLAHGVVEVELPPGALTPVLATPRRRIIATAGARFVATVEASSSSVEVLGGRVELKAEGGEGEPETISEGEAANWPPAEARPEQAHLRESAASPKATSRTSRTSRTGRTRSRSSRVHAKRAPAPNRRSRAPQGYDAAVKTGEGSTTARYPEEGSGVPARREAAPRSASKEGPAGASPSEDRRAPSSHDGGRTPRPDQVSASPSHPEEARPGSRREAPSPRGPGGPRLLGAERASPQTPEELMTAADTHRRQGRRAQAERLYARVAAHPAHGGLAEEATLRQGAMLAELGRSREAVSVLEAASLRFGASSLSPERGATLARLHLHLGHAALAAYVLEALPGRDNRVLDGPRLEVAEALVSQAPARAARLVAELEGRPGAVGQRARQILRAATKE